MNIAALIIGIEGWQEYTAPLIESLAEHEPDVLPVVIDNASKMPYPEHYCAPIIQRTERLCYSAAINHAHQIAGPADWYIVLSNDVLCTGPFVHMLGQAPSNYIVGPAREIEQAPLNYIVGPCLKETHGYQYLEGWCVFVPSSVWDALGGWDENFQVSSWEDVSFSQDALEFGYDVLHAPDLPFVHLDQRQRFTLVSNYWHSERHNITYFLEKRRQARLAYGR